MIPQGFTLRTAVEADIPVLRALARHIWHACYPGIISTAQIDHMLELMYSPERLLQEMRRGVRYLIVFRAEEPAGYLSFEALEGPARMRLHKLYVRPDCQGLGLGGGLLRHVASTALAAGLGEVELNVNRANARAIHVYRRAGFEIAGSEVLDIGGGYVMDDHKMRLRLRP